MKWYKMLVFCPLAVPILFPGSLVLGTYFYPYPKPRKIEVNGEMCDIYFKQTGITSTGAAVGHDMAVCNSKTSE